MADNVPITAGAGTAISTEEITNLGGSVVSAQHVQRVAWARRTADGKAIDVSAATATLTNVTGSTTSQTMHIANTARVAIIIANDSSSATLWLNYGGTASTSAYTYKLGTDDTLREELYTGAISGVWDASGAVARITELTA